jgi:hypothetical protein
MQSGTLPPPERRPTASERRWGIARIFLGQAQIIAATAGFVLLVYTGMSIPTVAAISVAGLLLLTSRLLFRRA